VVSWAGHSISLIFMNIVIFWNQVFQSLLSSLPGSSSLLFSQVAAVAHHDLNSHKQKAKIENSPKYV
jgi:hypothetical protein